MKKLRIFKKDNYKIIGDKRYLQPFYYGLNNEYKKLHNLLKIPTLKIKFILIMNI